MMDELLKELDALVRKYESREDWARSDYDSCVNGLYLADSLRNILDRYARGVEVEE